ncbi:MAG: hypothetical protein IJM20_00975 [Clostridia bacterium]|nr:hypothetical protein [Clostridia bacterium]
MKKQFLLILLSLLLISACGQVKENQTTDNPDGNGGGVSSAQPDGSELNTEEQKDRISRDEAIRIIETLTELHAGQYVGNNDTLGLKLSDTVAAELEQRRSGVTEAENRIGAHFVSAKAEADIVGVEQTDEGFLIRFTEKYEISYRYPDSSTDNIYREGIQHTAVVAFDGTVVSDIFNEEYSTGFNNSTELPDC